jgi:hypothetical protein
LVLGARTPTTGVDGFSKKPTTGRLICAEELREADLNISSALDWNGLALRDERRQLVQSTLLV